MRRRERARMIYASSVYNIASTELELIRQFKTLRRPIKVEGSIDEGRWVYWAKNTRKPDDVAMGRSVWKGYLGVFFFNYFGSVRVHERLEGNACQGEICEFVKTSKMHKMFKPRRQTVRQTFRQTALTIQGTIVKKEYDTSIKLAKMS